MLTQTVVSPKPGPSLSTMLVACLICAAGAVTVAAQSPKYGVTVTADDKVDFGSFRTYAWYKGQPSLEKTIDAQITAAVDGELGRLGMTRVPSASPDVLVAYYSLTRTDVNLKGRSDAKGVLPEATVGTLMVALLEPKSLRQVLRLRIDTPIDTERAALEAAIKTAVAEMFAKYPTRTNR